MLCWKDSIVSSEQNLTCQRLSPVKDLTSLKGRQPRLTGFTDPQNQCLLPIRVQKLIQLWPRETGTNLSWQQNLAVPSLWCWACGHGRCRTEEINERPSHVQEGLRLSMETLRVLCVEL